MDRFLASYPAAPVSIPGVPKKIPRIFADKKLSMLPRLIDSGQQRLNYIDQTHLVLASGKQVLQKKFTP